jgi:glyoxylase-like metal-dependent hydrolase (beta-lactamase superfamily II)
MIDAIQISDHFFIIPGENKARFPNCNGFLFTGPETLLIDAGIGKNKLLEIDRRHRIDVLLISHSHPDHFFCLASLKRPPYPVAM